MIDKELIDKAKSGFKKLLDEQFSEGWHLYPYAQKREENYEN